MKGRKNTLNQVTCKHNKQINPWPHYAQFQGNTPKGLWTPYANCNCDKENVLHHGAINIGHRSKDMSWSLLHFHVMLYPRQRRFTLIKTCSCFDLGILVSRIKILKSFLASRVEIFLYFVPSTTTYNHQYICFRVHVK